MNHFHYRNGELHAEDVAVRDIVARVGTPVYIYASATLRRHYQVFAAAFEGLRAGVFYALKANGNLAVVRTLALEGAGADVVGEGELRRALAAGVPARRIVFSGVGKTEAEMALALEVGIMQFNVESEPELHALNRVASDLGQTASIALRVNPDVDALTHAKISTGKSENKFGIPWRRVREVYAEAARLDAIDVAGIDIHIGSQLTRLEPFEAAFAKVAELHRTLTEDGHDIRRIDLGGGLGIPYDDDEPPHPARYAEVIRRQLGHLDCELVLEPGRLLVGNAGIMASRVIYVKEGEGRTFVVLDAAMNDLLRPAMYDAYHRVVPVAEPDAAAPRAPVDLVGPVCETADTFASNREMPPLRADDIVAFCSAGAYGAAMASTYNSRLLIPEVLVDGDRYAVVRPRPSHDDMLALDSLPPWLAAPAANRRGVA